MSAHRSTNPLPLPLESTLAQTAPLSCHDLPQSEGDASPEAAVSPSNSANPKSPAWYPEPDGAQGKVTVQESPSSFLVGLEDCPVTPFAVIADQLGLDVRTVRRVYVTGMTKLRRSIMAAELYRQVRSARAERDRHSPAFYSRTERNFRMTVSDTAPHELKSTSPEVMP